MLQNKPDVTLPLLPLATLSGRWIIVARFSELRKDLWIVFHHGTVLSCLCFAEPKHGMHVTDNKEVFQTLVSWICSIKSQATRTRNIGHGLHNMPLVISLTLAEGLQNNLGGLQPFYCIIVTSKTAKLHLHDTTGHGIFAGTPVAPSVTFVITNE